MKAQVLCRLAAGKIQTFNLRGDEAVLGREPSMAVSVPMEGVSRRHARIVFDGKAYWLEDLTSTNGTFLNGQAVRKERLRHLDVISLGRKADLLFVLRAEEAAPVKKLGIKRAALVPDAADALPREVGVGEATLGRSSACNIACEASAVSKVHARVIRTTDQLVLEDLGSSNGTFVNGQRVMTAVLKDGDVLALGGVELLRVQIEMGEITSSSGSREMPAVALVPKSEERPRFSAEWRTRFEWNSAEYAAIAAVQQRVATDREKTAKSPTSAPPVPASDETMMPSRKAQATPLPKAPAAEPAPPRPAPPQPSVPPSAPPVAAAPAKPAVPAPVVASVPAPRPPPAPAAPAPVAATPPVAPAAPPAGRILDVRLTAAGFDLAATDTGSHEMGRAKEAALRVNHPTVSRQHARLIISDDRSTVYVQDRGGANGTRLNGVAVEEIKMVQDGDTIGIGEVQLKVAIRRG